MRIRHSQIAINIIPWTLERYTGFPREIGHDLLLLLLLSSSLHIGCSGVNRRPPLTLPGESRPHHGTDEKARENQ